MIVVGVFVVLVCLVFFVLFSFSNCPFKEIIWYKLEKKAKKNHEKKTWLSSKFINVQMNNISNEFVYKSKM